MKKIKFLKNWIEQDGKKYRCHYCISIGDQHKRGTGVTIYARDLQPLPACLNAMNESDSMSDYFETDSAFISIDDAHFDDALKQAMKNKINQTKQNYNLVKSNKTN
jgi:hypothetical protein